MKGGGGGGSRRGRGRTIDGDVVSVVVLGREAEDAHGAALVLLHQRGIAQESLQVEVSSEHAKRERGNWGRGLEEGNV